MENHQIMEKNTIKSMTSSLVKTRTGIVDYFLKPWKHTHVDQNEPKTTKEPPMETTV